MPDPDEDRMVIIDAHLDLSWNALGWNRDLDQTVAAIRLSEAGIEDKGRATNTVAFPDMRRGRIGIALATVLARCNPRGRSSIDFRTQEIASATAQGQLAYYRLLERRSACRIPVDWYHAGLRVVGLAHYGPSAYAHGTGSPGGLTQAGRELLRVMEELNLILDMTHLADESFWQAADHFKGPVLASHNNCRAIVPGDRQFDDAQIRLIIERDGIIGAPFDAWMIVPGWKHGVDKRPSLDSSVRHID